MEMPRINSAEGARSPRGGLAFARVQWKCLCFRGYYECWWRNICVEQCWNL